MPKKNPDNQGPTRCPQKLGGRRRPRVAVLGGDGRFDRDSLPGCDVRVFQGRRFGGNGALRRIECSIKAGGVDHVVVLARWNGHSATVKVRRLCRRLGVTVEVRS